jgi:hypothetical protein
MHTAIRLYKWIAKLWRGGTQASDQTVKVLPYLPIGSSSSVLRAAEGSGSIIIA